MFRITSLFIIILILFGCSNEAIDSAMEDQVLIIKQINRSLIDSEDNCPGRFADFDSEGKITLVYFVCQGDTTTFIEYNYYDMIRIYTSICSKSRSHMIIMCTLQT